MPTLSNGGRTYTFRIRRGVRFSPPSNEIVSAETFRHTIERTLSKYAQGWDYAPDIVGAPAFKAGKAAHISGITARGSMLAITLRRPAGDLPTRLSMPVFCPVPRSTPLDPRLAHEPLPSVGPYYVASVERDRVVLLRNPNYRGNRPRHAARIVITDDLPTPKAVALADTGQLDYLPTDFSPLLGPGGPLDRRYGAASAEARAGRQRFFLHPQPMLDMIVFNTHRPLFRDARLRRAVGFAIDRAALAPSFCDAPAARLVPSGFPGFGTGGVYRLAPDLVAARRLVGAKPRRAVLLGACVPQALGGARPVAAREGRDRRLDPPHPGLSARASQLRSCTPTCCSARACSAARATATRRSTSTICSRVASTASRLAWSAAGFRRQLERAAPLRGRARIAALTRLDDELARAAPVLVYGAFQYGEYFGARVGCKRFPALSQGVDLGALCVHKQ